MASAVIIQDDPNLLKSLCEILELHGIQTWGATNGNKGIQLTQQHLPDMIITDYRLPDIYGWKVAFRLLQVPELLEIPIILMSASQNMPEIIEYQPLFDAYIPMPFNIEEWLNQINHQIKNKLKTAQGTISHSQYL